MVENLGSQTALCLIALGSNLGARGALLSKALVAIEGLGVVRAFSHVFETVPLGPSVAPFLNAALALETGLPPLALLQRLLAIETQNGRTRAVHWGARTLDLDLLLAGEQLIAGPGLVVPHPRLHERAFVLAPLMCIADAAIIPGLGFTVASAWRAISHAGVRLYEGSDVPAPRASKLATLQGS